MQYDERLEVNSIIVQERISLAQCNLYSKMMISLLMKWMIMRKVTERATNNISYLCMRPIAKKYFALIQNTPKTGNFHLQQFLCWDMGYFV
jgi:hypothetical protein